jgi:hypothetical protein
MSPNPATKVKWNGNYVFGNDVLTAKPEHGSLVAAVIAGWSTTETHLGRAFATLIGAKTPVTMGMYEAVLSFQIQKDLLRIAANEVLPKRYAEVFDIALTVLNRASADRNKFAHWVWGASMDPELDALFLVEPKHFWSLSVSQIKFWKQTAKEKKREAGFSPIMHQIHQPKLNREHIFVYKIKDLQAAKDRVEQAFRIAERLRQVADLTGQRRLKIYHSLCSEPDIQRVLADRKKKGLLKSAPKIPSQQKKPSKKKSDP